MTPNDIYALPNEDCFPWYDASCRLLKEIGIQDPDSLEFERAKRDDARTVTVERKLRCLLDWGERTASVHVVCFDGKPFAIYCSAGRGEQDYRDFSVTDSALYMRAKGHIESYLPEAKLDIIGLSDPIENLDFYGAKIIRHDGDVMMVREEYVSDCGKLLFDTRAYQTSFDELVRDRFSERDTRGELLNLHDVRTAAAEAILTAVPGGLKSAYLNDTFGLNRWHAALVATDTATYSIGLPSHSLKMLGFSWGSEISCEKIGGPELIDEMTHSADAAPHI